MSNDYVLLVTMPKPEMLKQGPGGIPPLVSYGELNTALPAVVAALGLFKPKSAPGASGSDGDVLMYEPGESEGGNGGGGDGFKGPMKARWGFHRKSFWNFRVCPSTTIEDDARFPPNLRFEACLHFGNLLEATKFLDGQVGGLPRQTILSQVFQVVQLVAVSERA